MERLNTCDLQKLGNFNKISEKLGSSQPVNQKLNFGNCAKKFVIKYSKEMPIFIIDNILSMVEHYRYKHPKTTTVQNQSTINCFNKHPSHSVQKAGGIYLSQPNFT